MTFFYNKKKRKKIEKEKFFFESSSETISNYYFIRVGKISELDVGRDGGIQSRVIEAKTHNRGLFGLLK